MNKKTSGQRKLEEISAANQARAEYNAATQGLGFTKDFRALDAVIQDPMATAGERVYAWIRRRAWGNYRLYCVNNEDKQPAFQRDCVKETGLHKQTVSSTIQYLEARGYVRTDGKILYPILSPVLADPPDNCKKVSHSRDFLTFVNQWKVSHSTDFQELESARATVKRLEKVKLAKYKEWVTSQTNRGLSLIESREREIQREDPPPPFPPPLVETIHEEEEPPNTIIEAETPPATPDLPVATENPRAIGDTQVVAQVIPASPCGWETFKSLYPKERLNWKAKKKFTAMPAAERQLVIRQLIRYLECDRWHDQNGRWIPNASNWLEAYDLDPPALIRIANATEQKAAADLQFTLNAYNAIYGGKK